MKTQQFDVSKYLDNDEMIAEYLKVAIEENDMSYFMLALGNVAKAKGMTQIAKDTGLGRESLYKAISGASQPKLDTVSKILNAIGLSLDIKQGSVSH
ncbi:MAG: putative addiction module antidote protein [Methylophaga sp.]|nr:MAG: putative addiction module antidote protein [Methylophaga sp.]